MNRSDMRYYSGRGDDGKTSLYSGRTKKNDPIVEAIGQIDELSSFIGSAFSKAIDNDVKNTLLEVEEKLYIINAELSGYLYHTKKKSGRLSESDVKALEKSIDRYSASLPPVTRFLLPNGSSAATELNICRTVARRAERSLTGLKLENDTIYRYVNRLSSLLFVLFRYTNNLDDVKERFF